MQTWIELCQKAQTDPHDLVTKNVDKLFDIILKASALDPKVGVTCFTEVPTWKNGAYRKYSSGSVRPDISRSRH